MSLMHLLAMGKSLIGLKGEIARYTSVQQNLLPKFMPVHQRFSQPLPPNTEISRSKPSIPDSPLPQQSTPSLPMKLMNPLSVHEEASASKLISPQKTVSNPLSPDRVVPERRSIFRNPFSSKSSVKSSRELVQAELALGAVKVVRNDLSEPDVEVIGLQVKPKAKTEANPDQNPPTTETAAPGVRRSRIAARLCDSGPSRA